LVKTIGPISTMSLDDTWPQEIVDRVSSTHGLLKHVLSDMGFEVLDEGNLLRSYKEMSAAGRSLRGRGVNALVIYVGTWTYANCAAAAALEAGVPVIVWGDATKDALGLVGASIVRGAMAEFGVHANMVYGPFDDPATLSEVKCLLDASCAAIGLRGQMLGVGGGRSMGMVTAAVDPNDVRVKFGVEIDSFEQFDVIKRAEAVSEDRAQTFFSWMKGKYGAIVPKDEVMLRQIRMYIATKDFCEEKGYDFVAMKCLPELPSTYTTFCIAHAVCGDCHDAFGPKERMVFSCEADLNAALTMQMMMLLTGGPIMFTDVIEYDFDDELLYTCNCGSTPTDFAKSPKDITWQIEGTHEFNWCSGGTCPQHIAKQGDATIARLYRNAGEYEMFIAPVEVVERSKDILKEFLWERPHAFMKLKCDRGDFFKSLRSNHIHLAYGDWIPQLEEMCAILGIKPVVVK
jgi:L-fucose/D-arabinose isomerase